MDKKASDFKVIRDTNETPAIVEINRTKNTLPVFEELTIRKMAENFGANYNQELTYAIFVGNQCIWNRPHETAKDSLQELNIKHDTDAALQMRTDISSLPNFAYYTLLGFAVLKTSNEQDHGKPAKAPVFNRMGEYAVATLIVRDNRTGKILSPRWIGISKTPGSSKHAVKSFMDYASQLNPSFLNALITHTK